MIDYATNLVSALNTVLPAYYEMALTSKITLPCISWQERNNYDDATGDTIGYSRLSYTVKVWAHDIKTAQKYALLVDKALRPLGFKRVASGELYDAQSTRLQKILTYEALASEKYKED